MKMILGFQWNKNDGINKQWNKNEFNFTDTFKYIWSRGFEVEDL